MTNIADEQSGVKMGAKWIGPDAGFGWTEGLLMPQIGRFQQIPEDKIPKSNCTPRDNHQTQLPRCVISETHHHAGRKPPSLGHSGHLG